MSINKKITFAILLLGVYLLSAGASYGIFNFAAGRESSVLTSPESSGGNKTQPGRFPVVDISGPKDQICPLNGVMYTTAEKNLWSQRRPMAVMIENHLDARPQSGLSKADIVYEAVAEGAITRFEAVYYCADAAYAQKNDYDIGPVRSARTYYLDWASEYGDFPLYVHVGGAGNCDDPTVDPKAKALCQISKYGWKGKGTWSDLDQWALGIKECRREDLRVGHEVAYEHQMYCSTGALWAKAIERGLTNLTLNVKNTPSWDKNFRSWLFKDDSASSGSVSPQFDFWRDYKDYNVKWEYDKATNSYKRYNGGSPHIDFATQQQIVTKNIVVMYVQETGPLDEHKHLYYADIGSGKAQIFMDGMVIEGKWSKKTRIDRTIFTNSAGKEIKFNRGQIWIEVLPTTGTVNY